MRKLLVAYLLGVLGFVFAFTGIFSLFLSIPGLLLAFASLRLKRKKIAIPIGYQGTVGKKRVFAQPFVTSTYLSYIAIGLNLFSIAVALFTTFSIAALLTVGMRQRPPSMTTEQQIIARVSALPEVTAFQKEVEQGGRSTFTVEMAGENLIQVLERFPDHQTTFGWYRYDPQKETFYRQNISTDAWEEVP